MKKFSRVICIALGCVAAGMVVVVVAINLYLQSKAVQERIRNSAAQALGAEVTINSTSYTPWGGLRLGGVEVLHEDAGLTPILKARALAVRFQLLPLLQKRFVIKEIRLIAPDLTIRQQEDRRWVLPFPQEQIPKSVVAEAPREAAPSPTPSPIRFQVEIQQCVVTEGSAFFIDHRQQVALRLEKVKLRANVQNFSQVAGEAFLGEIALYDRLFPQKIATPFTYENGTLTFSEITGHLAEGKLGGRFIVAANGATPGNFELEATLQDIALQKLAADAGFSPDGTRGLLRANLALRGNLASTEDLAGQGTATLLETQLVPFNFLQQLGQIFQIDELQLLRLQDADLSFQIGNERVRIEELRFVTDNLILTGSGPIRFNGKMDLDSKLLINEKMQNQLGGLLGKNFQDSETKGYKELPFSVTGTIDRPRTDLLEKITGIRMGGGSLGGLIRGLLGPSRSNNPTPTPTP